MLRTNNISIIEELASSQNGVFTAAQAKAFGIPRYALSYATKTGRIESICHGAYRLRSSIDEGYDELVAILMLTNPGAFTHDRIRNYDGVAVCGTTAPALHGNRIH
ncbi:MAG: type IV toxin-antitoxin system AbiEi family antitoxin domain-containing protein [Eggerthellaceae bacterium]